MNIFEIQRDLQAIFDELEETGGELTPELEEALNITESDFKNKIKDYTNVIKLIDKDIELVKEETIRLKQVKERKEKLKTRISNIIIDSIKKFGDTSKSGSKYIDYGDGKVSIRKTTSINTYDDLLKYLGKAMDVSLRNLKDTNQLDVQNEMDKEYFVGTAEMLAGIDEKVLLVEDIELDDTRTNITISLPTGELLSKDYSLLTSIFNATPNVKFTVDVDKTKAKEILTKRDSVCFSEQYNETLTIR